MAKYLRTSLWTISSASFLLFLLLLSVSKAQAPQTLTLCIIQGHVTDVNHQPLANIIVGITPDPSASLQQSRRAPMWRNPSACFLPPTTASTGQVILGSVGRKRRLRPIPLAIHQSPSFHWLASLRSQTIYLAMRNVYSKVTIMSTFT